MISRVTTQSMGHYAQHNLQQNLSEMSRLQQMASGGSLISRPSDDPTGAADAMRVRGDLRANEQYKRNIDDANGWLVTIDSALDTATDLLTKARDLVVQGMSDGNSDTSRDAIAVELDAIKKDLLNVAESQYLGRNVFAGNSDQSPVFAQPIANTYAFTGPVSTVERRIDANLTVRVDAAGAEIFGSDAADGSSHESIFALLNSVAAKLKTGDDVGAELDAVSARLDTVINKRAEVGTRHAQVLRAQEANLDEAVSLEARRSGIEDPDVGQVILDLKMQEMAYQTALAVTAKVLQPTLMDFLR